MTQMDLGQKINYTDKAVSKWERAESLPDVTVLKSIADIFGVTVDYLITSHAEWEQPPATTKELHFRPNAVITIVAISILSVAALLFIIFWMLDSIVWQVFVYAAPLVLLTALILNSLWNKGKGNFYIVSACVLSVLGVVYSAFLQAGHNTWQILLLFIPLELIVFFSFNVKRKNKKK